MPKIKADVKKVAEAPVKGVEKVAKEVAKPFEHKKPEPKK